MNKRLNQDMNAKTNVIFTFPYHTIITTVVGALTESDAIEAAEELLFQEEVSTVGAQEITVVEQEEMA